jgi:hypothetical protein
MSVISRITALPAVAVLAVLLVSSPGTAHAASPLVLEATYATVANGWARVDRYLDTTPGYTQVFE